MTLAGAAIVLALLAPLANGAQPAASNYKDILWMYKAGGDQEAVSRARFMNDAEIANGRKQVLQELSISVNVEQALIAMLLHTETYAALASQPFPRASTLHRQAALAIAREVADVGARERAFVREWLLLVIAAAQGHFDHAAADAFITMGRREFAGDADFLVAQGMMHEQKTFISNGYVPQRDLDGGYDRIDVKEELQRAATCFREALSMEPSTEARLRLGRVLHRLGDFEEATRELEGAREAKDNLTRVLAVMFLAALEADRGNRSRAAELNLAAMQIAGRMQSGFVLMAQLYFADGQPAAAERVITSILERPPQNDPWWLYLVGQQIHFDARLRRLRQAVRP